MAHSSWPSPCVSTISNGEWTGEIIRQFPYVTFGMCSHLKKGAYRWWVSIQCLAGGDIPGIKYLLPILWCRYIGIIYACWKLFGMQPTVNVNLWQKWSQNGLINLMRKWIAGSCLDQRCIICACWRSHPHCLRRRLVSRHRETGCCHFIHLKGKTQGQLRLHCCQPQKTVVRALHVIFEFYFTVDSTELFRIFSSRTNFKFELWRLQWLSLSTNA